jgi:hypothetical protein
MDAAGIIRRHDELTALRLPEERLWRETAELIRPEEADFAGPRTPRGYDEIFDSSPIYASDDFVGGLFGQASSPAVKWFSLGVPDQELMAWQPVKAHFERCEYILNLSMAPAAAATYTNLTSVYGDTGCFGLGTLHQEEDLGRGRILDRAVPLKELFIDVDDAGELATVHREFKLTGRQFIAKFGPVEGVKETDAGKIVIHAVYPNPDHEEGRLGPRGMRWLSCYVSPDVKDWSRKGGYREMPYHVAMWDQRAGRVYPRGPGHYSRADARQLNEQERSHIVAAQFAAEPMKLLHGDADITAADIMPNALLYGTMNEAGKQLMQVLNTGGNLQLSLAQSEQRRQAIRNAFRFSIMQIANRPQMTATEFLGFQEESLRMMGHNLVKIQTTLLAPFIKRRFAILARAGQMPEPPPELEGQMLMVGYVSPFDKAQKAAMGRSTLQWVGAVGQMAQIDPEAFDNVDVDGAINVLHDAFGPPAAVMADPKKRDERREARRQAQAQQVQLEQTGQAVTIAAEASHAAQAASLSKQRAA